MPWPLSSASVGILAIAAPALAQFTTGSNVSYSLDFVDVGGTPNGVLDPGESALLRLSVSFTNQNTTTTFSPPIPPYSSGTIRGFGSGFVDVSGVINNGGGPATGAWNLDYISPGNGPILFPWALAGPQGWGTPVGSGDRVANIQFGQFPTPPFNINTTNPINLIWQALWSPTSYNFRTITFTTSAAAPTHGQASAVIIEFSPTSIGSTLCSSTFGSVTFPMVPAPPSFALLAAPLLMRRRR